MIIMILEGFYVNARWLELVERCVIAVRAPKAFANASILLTMNLR